MVAVVWPVFSPPLRAGEPNPPYSVVCDDGGPCGGPPVDNKILVFKTTGAHGGTPRPPGCALAAAARRLRPPARPRRPPPRPRRAWGKWGRRTVTGAFGLAALKAAADAVRDPFVEEAYFMENGHLVAVAEDGSRMDLGPDPTGRKWMELGLGGR